MTSKQVDMSAVRARVGEQVWNAFASPGLLGEPTDDANVANFIVQTEKDIAAERRIFGPSLAVQCPDCRIISGTPCKVWPRGKAMEALGVPAATLKKLDDLGEGWSSWSICGMRMAFGLDRRDLLKIYESTDALRLPDEMFDTTNDGRRVIPMNTNGLKIAVGSTVKMTSDPRGIVFRPERFFASSHGWVINDLLINGRSQFQLLADVPVELFASNMMGRYPLFDDLDIGMQAEIVATRKSEDSLDGFYGGFVGSQGFDRRTKRTVR